MATYDAVTGLAAGTVRDWLGAVGREFGIVIGIAFAGVILAAAVALAPWPVFDDAADNATPTGVSGPAGPHPRQ